VIAIEWNTQAQCGYHKERTVAPLAGRDWIGLFQTLRKKRLDLLRCFHPAFRWHRYMHNHQQAVLLVGWMLIPLPVAQFRFGYQALTIIKG
jgi:hypothetical protein